MKVIDTERVRRLAKRINESSNTDFVKRLLDDGRKVIQNEDGSVSTHELAYRTDDDGNAVVYPLVQSVGTGIHRFDDETAFDRAIYRGDTLLMSAPDAKAFTEGYKEVYPGFDQYAPVPGMTVGSRYMPYWAIETTFDGGMYQPAEVQEQPEIDYFSPEMMERRAVKQRWAESGFRDKAVSRAGAQGAWQIMPIAYKDYLGRGRGKAGDLNDPVYNRKVRDWVMGIIPRDLGEFYSESDAPLTRLAKLYGAYNWGAGNMRKYLRKQRDAGVDISNGVDWVEGLNPETRRYIKYLAFDEDIPDSTVYTNAAFERAAADRGFACGGRLYEMGGPGDWLKEKAVDLWYRRNVKPKIDELGIDEVRNRLYRHISPYSYVEPDRRVKDALNDREPEFENFQRRHEGNIFPADRDDIFATYLGIPLSKRRWAGMNPDGTYTNNSPYRVIESEYRPSVSSNDNVDYKALTIDNFDKKRLMKMATEGGEDLSDYSIKHGNITPIFADYDKFRDVIRPPMNIGESRVSAALRKYFGPHTISVGVDPVRGQYVSYYDKWDLSPFSGNGDDETRGLGTPIEFYDRIYYDDYYGVDSRPQNPDEFYGGYIMPTTITANKEASGGKIRIKSENRGKFTALKKRTGHSASWFKAHGTPAQKKMAVFELNSRKWKHGDGGLLDKYPPDKIKHALALMKAGS